MAKKRQAVSRSAREHRAQVRALLAFFITLFAAKILWLGSLDGRGLLGADGESYLAALDGLLADGLFSALSFLIYWPAGYPILMWPISELSPSNVLFIVGILQSFIYSSAILFFAIELSLSSLKRFTWPTVILLNLSPTLSLNSVVIGYEVTSTSLLLLAIALYLRQNRTNKTSIVNLETASAAISMSLACFMQPRIALLSLGIIIPYGIYRYKGKSIPIFLAFSISLVAISPALLTLRNLQANGLAVVSTNLGVTMNIGAGPGASGGYSNDAQGVPCEPLVGDAAEQDRQKVRCVIDWYLANPLPATKLFANKFVYHWSPWFGPLANGTMARNPWLKFHPLSETAKTENGFQMIFGATGKLISWVWILGSLALLSLGFLALRRRGGDSTLLAWLLLTPVLLNALSSMATIGDHRFRIPTLTLSLLLQLFGLYSIFSRKIFMRGVEGEVKLSRGINWSKKQVGDNLQD
jgi:hypothetical protein